MRQISILGLMVIMAAPVCADPVAFTGAIGPYAIEGEVERVDDALTGRYRYAGRDAWIDLGGEAFGREAMRLDENVDGEETGAFYLDVVDGGLAGFWSNRETDYAAELEISGAALASLLNPVEEYDRSPGVTGKYTTEAYYVSSLFAPNYEVVFNGGDVDVVEVSVSQIFVSFDFVVGPTYHIASFQGLAKRTGPNTFVHNAIIGGSSEPCRLEFTFTDYVLDITDEDNGFACQFGARAHASFTLEKTSNIAEFQDSW